MGNAIRPGDYGDTEKAADTGDNPPTPQQLGSVIVSDIDCIKYESEDKDDTSKLESKQVYATKCHPIYALQVNAKRCIVPCGCGCKCEYRCEYEQDIQWTWPGAAVKNICFVNKKNETSDFQEKYLYTYGCVTAGPVTFDNVTWIKFGQAVKFLGNYIDQKSIVNCAFELDLSDVSGKLSKYALAYAFDLGYLGDACLFQHNGIHTNRYNKGLRVSGCNGGLISDNVINSDVLIESSKGIVFSANHMENGAQITVIQSQVNMDSNFIMKQSEPSVLIKDHKDGDIGYYDQNIVTFSNNVIQYMDGEIGEDAGHSGWHEETNGCAKCDIVVGETATLKIANSYRYRNTSSLSGKSEACGLVLQKEVDTSDKNNVEAPVMKLGRVDFTGFSTHSYFLSSECIVGPRFKIQHPQYDCEVDEDILDVICMANGEGGWIGNIGTYGYKYQLIWDEDRNLGRGTKSIPFFEKELQSDTVTIDSESRPWILIVLNPRGDAESKGILRLFRYRYDDTSEKPVEVVFADIPLCGARHLYDNGASVSGYTWETISLTDAMLSARFNGNVKRVSFCGENVVCTATSQLVDGTWKSGDVLLNIGNVSDWNIYIQLNNHNYEKN